eukprot:g6553.t1
MSGGKAGSSPVGGAFPYQRFDLSSPAALKRLWHLDGDDDDDDDDDDEEEKKDFAPDLHGGEDDPDDDDDDDDDDDYEAQRNRDLFEARARFYRKVSMMSRSPVAMRPGGKPVLAELMKGLREAIGKISSTARREDAASSSDGLGEAPCHWDEVMRYLLSEDLITRYFGRKAVQLIDRRARRARERYEMGMRTDADTA